MATRSGMRLHITLDAVSTSAVSGINATVADCGLTATYDRDAGTSSGQTDLLYSKTLTVSSTPTDLDFAGGSNVVDPATGSSATWTKIQGIMIRNTGSVQLQVGGDANSIPAFGAAADYLLIPAGGALAWDLGADGIAVTAGTGDILQLATASSSTTVQITVWGR